MATAGLATQVIDVTFTLNGAPVSLAVEPQVALIDMLRERLELKGTKRSCDVQVCGACTVLVDRAPVSSCTVLAFEVRGRSVTTIEGVAGDENAGRLIQALVANAGLQCGYCTPGMILAAKSLLDANPHPNEGEIKDYLSGNVCRCTGYKKILEAVVEAAGGTSSESR